MIGEPVNSNFLDDLLDRVNGTANESEEIPEPGSEGNPWLGVERVVRGQKTFYAFSGKELRRIRRSNERYDVKRQAAGQRAYNRDQRQKAFDAGTIRQQLRIISDELEVTPAMKANLTSHIMRHTALSERKLTEPDRKAARAALSEARLFERRHARVNAGKGRHADLVALGMREA